MEVQAAKAAEYNTAFAWSVRTSKRQAARGGCMSL